MIPERWAECKRWVEHKIQQAEDGEKALQAGQPEIYGMEPKALIIISLKIAIEDCEAGLQSREVPHNLRKWFLDTKGYCEALLKELAT